jgi:hypothetical protein
VGFAELEPGKPPFRSPAGDEAAQGALALSALIVAEPY